MTTEQMENMLDRVLEDGEFAELLVRDPRAAAADVGVELSDTEVDTVKAMTADELREFANEYKAETDPDKRRAAC